MYLLLITVIAWGLLSGVAVAADPDFDIHARGIFMVNTDSGETVFTKNADSLMYPASLTGIMTALLALESVEDLQAESVIISSEVLNPILLEGASNVALKAGEIIDMEDLVYAVLLPSGCDASASIAYHLGEGDIDAFVVRMNNRARELGALNTHFTNPTGLHDRDQVTTPYDMYRIASYAMSLPAFREIVSQTSYTMKSTNMNNSRTVVSTNLMMNPANDVYDSRIVGVKSGFTSQAGRCMISTAADETGEYLLVVMGANLDQRAADSTQANLAYLDSRNLYDWAFENFTIQRLTSRGEELHSIPVKSGSEKTVALVAVDDCSALLEAGQNPIFIQHEVSVIKSLKAPVEAGINVGKVVFTLDGEEIGSVGLVTATAIKRSWFWPILFGLGGLILLAIILLRIRNNKRNQFRTKRGNNNRVEPRQYQDLAR